MCERCEPRKMSPEEKMQYELYKAINWGLLYGRAGEGKNKAAAEQVRQNLTRMRRGEALECRYINGNHIVGYLKDEATPKMPQKICNYHKPKVYWFGEGGNNVPYTVGSGVTHWAVCPSYVHPLIPDSFFKSIGDTVETGTTPYKLTGTSTGRFSKTSPLERKRFIGISEPTESEKADSDFLMRFTEPTISEKSDQEFFADIFGDVVAKRLYDPNFTWEPKGTLSIMSGSPLPKIKDKDESSS